MGQSLACQCSPVVPMGKPPAPAKEGTWSKLLPLHMNLELSLLIGGPRFPTSSVLQLNAMAVGTSFSLSWIFESSLVATWTPWNRAVICSVTRSSAVYTWWQMMLKKTYVLHTVFGWTYCPLFLSLDEMVLCACSSVLWWILYVLWVPWNCFAQSRIQFEFPYHDLVMKHLFCNKIRSCCEVYQVVMQWGAVVCGCFWLGLMCCSCCRSKVSCRQKRCGNLWLEVSSKAHLQVNTKRHSVSGRAVLIQSN